jgi:hypothetical protein
MKTGIHKLPTGDQGGLLRRFKSPLVTKAEEKKREEKEKTPYLL